MTDLAMVSGAALGLVHGARHAFEPDHVAALSAMVADDPSGRTGLRLGAAWGVGHTLTLCAVGLALAITGATLPPAVDRVFELAVAVALIALGARAIARGSRARAAHHHDVRSPRTALAFGMLHGLAGSGALTALTFAELSSTSGRIAFMAVFGAGSIAAMAALSGTLGAPLARLRAHASIDRALRMTTGALAIAVGLLVAIGGLS